MFYKLNALNLTLVSLSVISGAIALTLASVGIGSSNWQTISDDTSTGQLVTNSFANFFYACLDIAGVVQCGQRTTNYTNIVYYIITAPGTPVEWNLHLNFAAGLCIIGIIFIFIGSLTTLLMFFGDRAAWIFLIAPTFLFVACLFMLAGLAEGIRVLKYNDYAAYLYETGHALTIFSLLTSAMLAGRLFDHPLKSQDSTKLKRTR